MAPIGQSGNGAQGGLGALLGAQTAARGHSPYLVFYDDRSGERTEMSYATFFNWTSKAANLLAEEFDLERGGSIAVDIRDHWTGAVVVVAAWSVGAAVSFSADASRDVLVVREDDADGFSGHGGLLVVGSGMGGRVTRDVPGLPFGDEVLAFGDDYSDPAVGGDDAAVVSPPVSQADLRTAAEGLLTVDDRLLATAPLGPETVAQVLVAPLLTGASVVWCPAGAPDDLSSRIAAERVTHVLGEDGAVTPLT